MPILVKSSIALNALPSLVGVSSWVPMHGVAQAIVDVALSPSTAPALNIVHPRPVPFDNLVSSINDALVSEGVASSKLPVVSFPEWFALLEKRAAAGNSDDLKDVVSVASYSLRRDP